MRNDEFQDMLPYAGTPTEEHAWKRRVAAMLDQLALEARPCKACGVKIWLVRLASGKVGAWNDDATSHFATCPRAAEFRKEAKR